MLFSYGKILSRLSILTIFLLLLSGCELVYFFTGVPDDRDIAGPFEVNTEWTTITFEPPLKINKWAQTLYVAHNGNYHFGDLDEAMRVYLRTANGDIIKTEIEVFDDEDNRYTLEARGTGHWQDDYAPAFGIVENGEYRSFPVGRSLTKMRVRSNIPFRISMIQWKTSLPH